PTDYLGHPQIYSIVQGADNFIYFANVQGILQFDGIRWIHHSAPLTFTYRLAVDSAQRVWVSRLDQFGYFEARPGEVDLAFHSLHDEVVAAVGSFGRGGDLVLHDNAVFVAT